MPRSELAQRVLVAAVGIPLAIGIVYLGGWVLAALLAAIAAGAALEFYRLAATRGARAFVLPGAVTAAGLVLLAAARPTPAAAAASLWMLVLVFVLAISAAAIWARGPGGQPMVSVATTIVGALLPGGTLGYAIFLRHFVLAPWDPARATWGSGSWTGAALVAFPLAVTWIGDSAAYFAGKAWGRRKLIPSVSPGKTVVGAVAGLVSGAVVGVLFAQLVFTAWLRVPLGPVLGAVGGAILALAAQVGDLAESVLKRDAGVKDSGRLLPGHGGVLDRFDALFFAIPVAYWFLRLVLPFPAGGAPWR